MMERRIYRKESYAKKVKKGLGKYLPKPGLAGGVGAILGAGIGSIAGFVGSSARYLLTEGGNYLLNGGMDAIFETYEHASRAAGEWALIGGVGGMVLFAKFRDTVYNFLGLENKEVKK